MPGVAAPASGAPPKSPFDPRAVALTMGAYMAQSVIAANQRCINLYPERNPQDAYFPFTHYQTPGLTPLCQAPNGGVVRGVYRATNGNLYAAIDQRIFYVSPQFQMTQIGALAVQSRNPVSMKDNGVTMLIADGSPNLYSVVIQTNQFQNLGNANSTWLGADKVDYIDTFFLFNITKSPAFGSSLSNTAQIDPTYFAGKTGQPDTLQTLAVAHHEIWLLGERTTELWADAGNPTFPFASLPGAFIDHGCAAKYSPAVANESVFWLSEDDQGKCMVLKGKGYQAGRVSTHAIEQEFQGYARFDDAIGYTYQMNGHTFYVLTFPAADKTWVYDDTSELWHEWKSMDTQGVLHRHRSNCHAFAYGINIVGDFLNGTLYKLDENNYSDNGAPILRLRSFPVLYGDGRRVSFIQFVADMEMGEGGIAPNADFLLKEQQTAPIGGAGSGLQTTPALDIALETGAGRALAEDTLDPGTAIPKVALRWSDTNGKSWGNPVMQTIGQTGQYLTQLSWRRLGQARFRIFEISWTAPVKTALNGAYVVAKAHAT